MTIVWKQSTRSVYSPSKYILRTGDAFSWRSIVYWTVAWSVDNYCSIRIVCCEDIVRVKNQISEERTKRESGIPFLSLDRQQSRYDSPWQGLRAGQWCVQNIVSNEYLMLTNEANLFLICSKLCFNDDHRHNDRIWLIVMMKTSIERGSLPHGTIINHLLGQWADRQRERVCPIKSW